jgi:hypothetical protein
MGDPNGNPFDAPLQSELGEHQQAQANTVQGSSNGNPFDEPLLSEKAEAQHTDAQNAYRKATAAGANIVPGAAEKAMGQVWGDNAAQTKQFLKSAGQATLETAGGILGASEFTPVTEKALEYLPHLAKIAKVAKDLGWTTFGLKEAHDLYRMAAGDSKK